MSARAFRQDLAARNLHNLSTNSYPGRIIIVGLDESGSNVVMNYGIMGRSPPSRNRVFKIDGERVFTDTIDKSIPVDPLSIYDVMQRHEDHHIVSNGDQTKTIMTMLGVGGDFHGAMEQRYHEPDLVNFTSRIAAMISVGKKPVLQIGIIRKEEDGEGSERVTWNYDTLIPGYGLCIHTYEGDVPAHAGEGGRLPPFVGEPRLLRLGGDLDEMAECWWEVLNPENKVALVSKIIPLSGGMPTFTIINKADRT